VHFRLMILDDLLYSHRGDANAALTSLRGTPFDQLSCVLLNQVLDFVG